MQKSSFVRVWWIDENNPADTGITEYRNMTNDEAHKKFRLENGNQHRILGFQNYTTEQMTKKLRRRK